MQSAPEANSSLVVMYHYVGQEPIGERPGFVSVSEAAFDQQVHTLLEHYDPIDWPTFIETRGVAAGGERPRVLFTFDDGLRCQAECAAAVLERYNTRGLFFVPGATLKDRTLLDAHRIHILLSMLDDNELLEAVGIAVPHADKYLDHGSADRIYHYESSPARRRLKYLLAAGLPTAVRTPALCAIFADRIGDERKWAERWYPTAGVWSGLARRGHTLGAHGFCHERLDLLDADAQLVDLRASVDIIAGETGHRPTVLSYPYGAYDARTIEVARAAGFIAAVTTRHAFDDETADPMELPRVDCARLAECIPQAAEASR